MRRVFVDSAYWIALREKVDPHHERARSIAKWLMRERAFLVVTPFIFAEVYAYFCRVREVRAQVIRDFWENRIVIFERTTFEDEKRALEILKQHQDKNYSFADAISFVVMLRMKLEEVVTFDRHFSQFGAFQVIDNK